MYFRAAIGAATLWSFAHAQLSALENYVDSVDLGFDFNPVKEAYWTSLPRHRRTPFSVSPDGTSAYLAYLDNSGSDVHVIEVDPTDFTAKGTPVTVSGGEEAGGLVAQNDGFALLTNVAVTTGTNIPPSGTPVPVIVRYTDGEETWRTFVGGPGVHEADGLSMSPDMNGDLVYSDAAGLYGAYFVITDYTGDASGHYGDSIQYVDDSGTLETISGASSSWGCSHNTGIAFESADAAPFASICAEDQGNIWLNTNNGGMSLSGSKISGENTTNGASGEPMGGMSGSYSSLALFPGGGTEYIFAWRTRGCVDLTENTWMGDGYTQCKPRQMNGNVAVSLMTDKETLKGEQAISTVGATDGDTQLTLITSGTETDHSNVHVATFDSANALVTWEEIADPTCELAAFGCSGTFSGAKYQLVDNNGNTAGDAISSMDTFVAGDIVNIGNKLCWPYVNMTWDLSLPVGGGLPTTTVSKMSFACIGLEGSSNSSSTSTSSSASVTVSTAAAVVAASSSTGSATTTTAAAVELTSSAETSSTTQVSSAVQSTTTLEPTSLTSLVTSTSAPAVSSTQIIPTTLQTVSTSTRRRCHKAHSR
ncbi:hypothetical protein UCRPC4_g04211 [Phaeomoniella chlamydospora]|uniref:Uncharacterized protein n=1 Tax=Phaeomoniella chlamydospora TaxID=158046 RepID=A0A0G2EB72_PHACM|nr:hypothetical protein UCRPC4_g04211 [Phaeomoniella chlamydospora]